jgi:hypothetical protein
MPNHRRGRITPDLDSTRPQPYQFTAAIPAGMPSRDRLFNRDILTAAVIDAVIDRLSRFTTL